MLSLWVVAVYNLRVAIAGNPLFRCVADAPDEIVRQVDQAASEDGGDMSPEATVFLQRFVARFCIALAILLMELTLLVRLFWIDHLPWLALGVLVKDLVAAAIGSLSAHSLAHRAGIFETLRIAPLWVRRLDRTSSLISGMAALIFLLVGARA
jgi:hypothetical protein